MSVNLNLGPSVGDQCNHVASNDVPRRHGSCVEDSKLYASPVPFIPKIDMGMGNKIQI